ATTVCAPSLVTSSAPQSAATSSTLHARTATPEVASPAPGVAPARPRHQPFEPMAEHDVGMEMVGATRSSWKPELAVAELPAASVAVAVTVRTPSVTDDASSHAAAELSTVHAAASMPEPASLTGALNERPPRHHAPFPGCAQDTSALTAGAMLSV